MIHVKWRSIRFPAKSILFPVLSAALLSSIAKGQLPTTTALPYVLANPGYTVFGGVVSSYPVHKVPQAVTISGFAGLLGGGFGSALSVGAGPTAEAAAAAVTIAALRKAVIVKALDTYQKGVKDLQQDTLNAKQTLEQTPGVSCGSGSPNVVKLTRSLGLTHRLTAADSSTCMLEQEQEAEEAEEELQELSEGGNVSEEALEAAEEAAEVAEIAAEAAEEAAEAAEIGIDILEGVLDALSLF